jgi:hypothetical protein
VNFKIRWFQTPRFIFLVDGLDAYMKFMLVDCFGPNYRECHPALAINHSHTSCNPQLVMDCRNARARRGNIKSVRQSLQTASLLCLYPALSQAAPLEPDAGAACFYLHFPFAFALHSYYALTRTEVGMALKRDALF